MASSLVDLVKINVTSVGTSALTLGNAATGYRGKEALTNGAIYGYAIQQGGALEYGRGTYLSATSQLTRAPLYSSDGGTPINLQPNAQVAFVALAEDLSAVQLTADAQAAAVAAIAAGIQTAADREQTGLDAAAANASAADADSSAENAAASLAAVQAAFAAGAIRIFSSTANALSNGVIGYTITAGGSGGTNGSYALSYSGGAGTGAAAKVLVSGGALTSVTMQQRGANYTSAPTISYTITGLTGGGIAAIIGANTVDGDFFGVPNVSGSGTDIYKNVAGTAVFQYNNPSETAVETTAEAAVTTAFDGGSPLGVGSDASVEDRLNAIEAYLVQKGVVDFAYQAETAALAAAFTAPPTQRRKKSIDWAIRTLKGDNSLGANPWAKIIGLWVIGANEQASQVNWKTPGTNTLTKVGAPTFTADLSYNNVGTTKYLRTGIYLDSLTPTNCFIGYYAAQVVSSTTPSVGATDSSGNGLNLGSYNSAGTPTGAAGGPSFSLPGVAGSTGTWSLVAWKALNRLPSDSGNVRAYKAQRNVGATANVAAGSFGHTEILLGAHNNNGTIASGGTGFFAACVAIGLTDAEQEVLAGVIQELQFERTYGELDDYEPGTSPASATYDAIVYGATSGGMLAAYRLKQLGLNVAVVGGWRERSVGGMSSGGLGGTDWNAIAGSPAVPVGMGGLPQWVLAQISASKTFDPRLFRAQLHKMFDPGKNPTIGQDIPIYWSDGVIVAGKTGTECNWIMTADGRQFFANAFIEASYECDLLRVLGVSMTSGRDAAGTGAEAVAGFLGATSSLTSQFRGHQLGAQLSINPFVNPSDPTSPLLPYIAGKIGDPGQPAVGAADGTEQAQNFRLTLTGVEQYIIPISTTAPPNYSAANYEALARWVVAAPTITAGIDLFGEVILTGSNSAVDMNSFNGQSTDMPGSGTAYKNAPTYAAREVIWKQVENYIRGLLYFVLYEPDSRLIGSALRTSTAAFGWHFQEHTRPHPNDAFGWPTQLYVRSCRRLVGDFVLNANDIVAVDGTTPRSTNTIATSAYYVDDHANQWLGYNDPSTGWRIVKEGSTTDTGTSNAGVDLIAPIPMEVLFPKRAEMTNVVTCWGWSTTRLAFDNLRMEFTHMATAVACAHILALRHAGGDSAAVQDTNYATLRTALLAGSGLSGETAPSLPQIN